MPVALTENSVRFPTGFAPWYVYKATLVGSPATFEYGDILLADSAGEFDKTNTVGVLNLEGGYAMALEPFVTGMTEVQVAVPGSVFPAIGGSTSIQPGELVSISQLVTTFAQTIVPATGAQFADGEVMGRYRNQHFNNEILRLSESGDIINVLTGLA